MKYFDTHSHIADYYYDNEIDQYIKTLIENDIFTNAIGCDLESSIRSINLAKKYPNNIKACVGIHPNDVKKYINDKTIFYKLDELIKNNTEHIVAIGEIGLDFFYDKNDEQNIKNQIYFCNKQIELAHKYNLPIMYHIRDAFEKIKPIIKQNNHHKQIIHCFSTDIIQANYFIENNCLISIPGIVTFKNAISLQEAIKSIDINYLVAETDSPYLTPVPYRGKKNYPHYVQYVYEQIAKLKKMDLEKTRKQINQNALKFFNINI